MPRIWLRLELFELGLLPLPSKLAASLTITNVRRSLDALHCQFHGRATGRAADASGDAVMEDAGEEETTTSGTFEERDNLQTVSFSQWKAAVEGVFQWREQDYRAFWLLLVRLHRCVPTALPAALPAVLDDEQSWGSEHIPVFKIAILLFVQTVKPHSWRSKYSLESFNAVWYREHAESLSTAAAAEGQAHTGSKSPRLGSASPHLGAASPPPPASPHTVGLQDRSTSDAYYLEFVREKLHDLFSLLYPSVKLGQDADSVLSAELMDLLGFLLCCGDASAMMDRGARLSDAYLAWKRPGDGEEEEEETRVESADVIARFCKTHLTLNEKLYPPVGFSLSALSSIPALGLNDGFSLDGEEEPPVVDECAPTVLSQLTKTTVIKRPDEFADAGAGRTDLIVFSCLDSFIYVLGAVRTHVMITACKNCRIVTGPSTGILSLDRCENVQLTTITALARISNCLDSRINLFTPCRPILSGENVGVVLGPYNSKFPGLGQQLAACGFPVHRESAGCWDAFLNLDAEREESMEEMETDKAPIALQQPSAFREVCIPVKPSNSGALGPAERPFAIPAAFAAALKTQLETVEALRQLVRSDEFDLATKRTIEMVIQIKFKDWLTATGHVRQVLDLVHLDRASGEVPSSSASLKDRA